MEKDSNKLAVCVTNACKYYGAKQILDQLNMYVEKGTIYGLLGASGCGKTTLLSCIVGRKKLQSGQIWVLGGEPGMPESGVPGSRVGYMPQDVALIAEFTVKDAIYYFGRILRMKDKQIEEKFKSLSRLLDLPPADRLIKCCSGGQKRRVSFAASMVSTPELLILDEPTVGLDPVLRESIWRYLLEITETLNTAVIITTHYIEETRQAHKIGLMRQGKLLAEETPDRLLNLFHTDSLEEVFLSLSKRQTEGRKYEISAENMLENYVAPMEHSSSTVSMVMSDLNNSKDMLAPKHTTKRKAACSGNGFGLNSHRLWALWNKNCMQIFRNFSGMAFMLIFPIIEMLAFFMAIGNDVRDIGIAVINEEDVSGGCANYSYNESAIPYGDNKCSFRHLGCRFLEIAEDPMMDLIPYRSLEEAKEGIKHGKVSGALHIHSRFSKSIEDRFTLGGHITAKALNTSQIDTYLDMSNRQIGATIKFKLVDKIQKFQRSLLEQCQFFARLGDIPVRFEEEVYGHIDENFRVFMIPGVLLTIMFFMGATNASTIIISERVEGVWDRSIVAGVSSVEIIFTHFITQFLLVIIQSAIVLFFTFVIYQTEFLGNFGTIILLILLEGAAGMAFGFWISVVSNSHSMANIITCGSFYPMIIICGLVWPLEGMPIGLRWIANCMPFTVPIISMRNVIKKGWSLIHLEVINGVIIEIVWIIIFGLISGLELKRKR